MIGALHHADRSLHDPLLAARRSFLIQVKFAALKIVVLHVATSRLHLFD